MSQAGSHTSGTPPLVSSITVVIQTFTSNGTYTPTPDLQYAIIECIGGGGAGGGAVTTIIGETSVGGGGGAGEYARGVFSAGTIGASQAVTIGSGGTGVAGATGNNGGTTSLGALITAFGGLGGITGSPNPFISFAVGGSGGTGGAGGSLRSAGNPGGSGFATPLINTEVGISGYGGISVLGSGASSVANTLNTSTAGSNAAGYGSGGSGGLNFPGKTQVAGGNGTSGIVIITEYVLN